MSLLFLIGGGWNPAGQEFTFGRFVEAATNDKVRKIILVIADDGDQDKDEVLDKYLHVFNALGVEDSEIIPLFISDKQSLSEAFLIENEPTGVFVGGGLTPLYHQGVCVDARWVNYLLAHNIPYGGFSAGAALAAQQAIVGGWKMQVNDKQVPILDADLAEDLEFLDVRDGLGMTSFSIDVHASQWGTLTRLLHAVDQQVVGSGWAIDEDTMLHIENDQITVYGLGQAYYVKRSSRGKLLIEIFRDGDVL